MLATPVFRWRQSILSIWQIRFSTDLRSFAVDLFQCFPRPCCIKSKWNTSKSGDLARRLARCQIAAERHPRSLSKSFLAMLNAQQTAKRVRKMTDADKMVAATFAVARCGGLGHSKPEDYIAEYDDFLRLLIEREATTERAEKDASLSPWKFGS